VTRIVAWTGPGAISRMYRPGELVLPDDLLDFTGTARRPSTREGDRLHPPVPGLLRNAAGRAAHRGGPGRSPAWQCAATRSRAHPLRRHVRLHRGPRPRDSRRDPVPRARRGGSRRDDPVPRGVPRAGTGDLLRAGGVRDELRGGGSEMPYRPGALFEGMLPPMERRPSRRRKTRSRGSRSRPPAPVAGEERDCPCAVSMERYRKRGVIAPTSALGRRERAGR